MGMIRHKMAFQYLALSSSGQFPENFTQIVTDISEKLFFYDISESRLNLICIFTSYDLNYIYFSLKASLSVNFERFTL